MLHLINAFSIFISNRDVMYLLALNLHIKLDAVCIDLDAVDIKLGASLCIVLVDTCMKLL